MPRRPAAPPALPLDFDGWPRIERQDLTDWLAELADVAGLEAVRFLVTRFGDEQLSVPKTYREHKLPVWLEETRDLHSAALVKTIIRLFGGANVHMPAPCRCTKPWKTARFGGSTTDATPATLPGATAAAAAT